MPDETPQHSRPRGVPPFAPELNSWSLDELQTAVRLLEGLEEMPGWQTLAGVIEAAREQMLETLVYSERELTQAQYAHLTGTVKGLGMLTTALEGVRWKAQERERKERLAVERGQREESAL